MEFGDSAEQGLLRKSFSDFLKKECPLETVRECLADDDGYSASVWRKMADLGWLGLGFPETYGGSDGSIMDQFILFEEIGRMQTPSPLFTAIALCAQLIHEACSESQLKALLPRLLSGDSVFAMANPDPSRQGGRQPSVSASRNADGNYRISGQNILVPYAHRAESLLVWAATEEPVSGSSVFRVNTGSSGLSIAPLVAMTGEKLFAVTFRDTPVAADQIIGKAGEADAYLKQVCRRATLLKCAEMIGGMQEVVDRTIAYVKEREQFGKPLGTLQAVQHYCVDMKTLSETGKLLAYQAASCMEAGQEGSKEVAMAKAWCSDAYRKCTWMAHQIHGGIGFTEEYDLHLYYKHAKSAELAFGDPWDHRTSVADSMGL